MAKVLARFRAVVGLAAAQLRHQWVRTLLAVLGVALAVLLVVLLTGLGHSVITTGERGISALDQDLWITGEPLGLAPSAAGSVESGILNAHNMTQSVESHSEVENARALAFQTVYIGANKSSFETVVGVGGNGNGSAVNVDKGETFDSGDVHYANGTYSGPMTHEVIIDERTADLLGVSVGDTVYMGGTTASARQNKFTVIGISTTIERFLGAPSATLHLSELQEITGTTGTDPASIIIVTLEPGADTAAVKTELEQQYPAFTVRTTDEQFRSVLSRQSFVIAGATTLVGLAIVAGVMLLVNILSLFVYHQRSQLAALKASGVSSKTLIGIVGGQGFILGLLGGSLGLAVTPLAVLGVNYTVARVIGFENLIHMPQWALLLGFGLALLMGLIGTVVAGWRVGRISPLVHLDR